MEEESVFHVSSEIPIYTSTGTKTGILDPESGGTLIKKELVEEISELEKPRPSTKLIKSSERRKQEILGVVDIHLHTEDQDRESKISTYLHDTTAIFDALLGTDFLQQEQEVMAWTKEGLKTFLIPGLAVKIYDPIASFTQQKSQDKFGQLAHRNLNCAWWQDLPI
jgi:hypothetical protein